MGKKSIQYSLGILLLIIAINVLGNYYHKRFDLTQDKRYTLSEPSKKIIKNIDSPLTVDIFLKGNFPPEFRRLQDETKELLESFSAYNANIHFAYIDPTNEKENGGMLQSQIQKYGMNPAQVSVMENGKQSTQVIYPWALARYQDKTVKISLLKNQLGSSSEERVNNSIQNLEYAFADGFNKLTVSKKRKVAVLKGNGELDDRYIADFFRTLRDYYFIAPFTLDSVAVSPQKALEDLNKYDLIVSAKPTEPFSDAEKYILDQYIMNGGTSLWFMDATTLQTDTVSGKTFAFGIDLNMNDFFFKYGIRINPDLVKDIYSAPIVVASGEQQETQYSQYPWFYSPLAMSNNTHPINSNIEAVKFDYASPMDILPNDIRKTVLLSSSPISKIVGLPLELDISKEIPKNLKIVNEGPPTGEYINSEIPLAVLLEGEFTSVFNNRVKPFKINNALDKGKETKMVVISDGDVIKNQLDRNKPLELGYDKWTNSFYGNKEFLLNTVNFLLDDNGLINIRTKKIVVPFLDQQEARDQRTIWQLVNIAAPLLILGIFGFFFTWYRKRKYSN